MVLRVRSCYDNTVCADLKGKVSEATNRFFEARVAVMGFKCRVMQLQGEMERKQLTSPVSDMSGRGQAGDPLSPSCRVVCKSLRLIRRVWWR